MKWRNDELLNRVSHYQIFMVNRNMIENGAHMMDVEYIG